MYFFVSDPLFIPHCVCKTLPCVLSFIPPESVSISKQISVVWSVRGMELKLQSYSLGWRPWLIHSCESVMCTVLTWQWMKIFSRGPNDYISITNGNICYMVNLNIYVHVFSTSSHLWDFCSMKQLSLHSNVTLNKGFEHFLIQPCDSLFFIGAASVSNLHVHPFIYTHTISNSTLSAPQPLAMVLH